jgi:hypothetical protein
LNSLIEIAVVVAASVFWEPNCDPGRFEMMLDAKKLQDLVITACGKDTLINSLIIHKHTVARNLKSW